MPSRHDVEWKKKVLENYDHNVFLVIVPDYGGLDSDMDAMHSHCDAFAGFACCTVTHILDVDLKFILTPTFTLV